MLADACEFFHRPGMQGGARRTPDGAEGHRPGRGDAEPPRGHRPALPGPSSRLARARRPRAQDHRDPGGDGLADPDPAQARRRAGLRRRADGGEVRPPTPSTSTGMEGGTGAGPHLANRGDRGAGDGGHPPGAPGDRRPRQAGRDLPRLRGRDPQRRGRRQGPRPRRGRGRHRALGADGPQLQQGHSESDYETEMGVEAGALLPTAIPAGARWAWRRRTRRSARASTRTRRRSGSTTSCTR